MKSGWFIYAYYTFERFIRESAQKDFMMTYRKINQSTTWKALKHLWPLALPLNGDLFIRHWRWVVINSARLLCTILTLILMKKLVFSYGKLNIIFYLILLISNFCAVKIYSLPTKRNLLILSLIILADSAIQLIF